ncbi:hypothetical protein BKA66DRAFT_422017 [Pyrenochaeta sp. MPI-SDFR-AT-0127]|nr:hypothetical protein BKA66DRAFT_422017 [Pyrenochaeta sp. MPI-SDFR-AT-0127]
MAKKGVLWVSSRVVHPASLSVEKFCEWYENTHIQEVLSLAGIPSAVRYEALQPQPDAKAWSNEAPWLTVYEMPDIEYRNTDDFKSLDGQSEPSQNLLEGVFKNARFDTRFYEEVQVFENEGVQKGQHRCLRYVGPATFILSAVLQPAAGAEPDFDAWYREEHIAILSRAPGFVRTRRYELVSGTTLDKFKRVEPEIPKYLALHEFEGDVLPVMGGLVGEEVGWYRLKRKYAESEWGSIG